MKFLRPDVIRVSILIVLFGACVLVAILGLSNTLKENKVYSAQKEQLLRDHVNKCYESTGQWIKIDDKNYMCVFPQSESLK